MRTARFKSSAVRNWEQQVQQASDRSGWGYVMHTRVPSRVSNRRKNTVRDSVGQGEKRGEADSTAPISIEFHLSVNQSLENRTAQSSPNSCIN